jgi:hypothetical protein
MELLIIIVTAGVCSGRSILSLTNQSMPCDNESRHVTAVSELALIVPAAESTFHLCKDIYVPDIYRKNNLIFIKYLVLRQAPRLEDKNTSEG